jgi:hypothetical protein
MDKTTVINYFKSGANTARFLKITRASVSEWGKVIPEKQALKLERLTKGGLKYDPSLYEKKAA